MLLRFYDFIRLFYMVFENGKSGKCGNHILEGKPQSKVQDESKLELCGNNGFLGRVETSPQILLRTLLEQQAGLAIQAISSFRVLLAAWTVE
ncbi:MAG: hypothetical protein ACREOI_11500 [bacterium]